MGIYIGDTGTNISLIWIFKCVSKNYGTTYWVITVLDENEYLSKLNEITSYEKKKLITCAFFSLITFSTS